MLDFVIAFAATVLLSLTISGALSYWNMRKCRLALQQASSLQKPFDSYLHYLSARKESHRKGSSFVVRFVLIAIVLVSLSYGGQSLIGFQPPQVFAHYFYPTVIICIWISHKAVDFSVDTRALRLFQFGSLSRTRSIVRKLASLAIDALTTVILWIFFSKIIEQYPSVAWIFPPFTALGLFTNTPVLIVSLIIGILLVVATYLLPLTFATFRATPQSIEETPWAEMAPRIRAWGKRMNIEFASILVTRDAPGDHKVHIVGHGQGSTLLLSETLLLASEWRQQDALICLAIAEHKRHSPVKAMFMGLWLMGVVLAWLASGLLLLSLPDFAARGAILAGVLIGLPVVAVALPLFIMLVNNNGWEHELDRLIVHHTGDPLALIAAHYLTAAFSGEPRKPFDDDERIQQLVKFGNRPWPRSSYATIPVPCILSITINNQQITAPPATATTPEPVPNTLFSEAMLQSASIQS